MGGSLPQRHVHVSTLAVALPTGWSVSEGATLRAPSGQEIEVRVGPVPASWGPVEFVDDEVGRAQTLIETVDVGDAVDIEVGGDDVATARDIRFDQEGTAYVARLACRVAGEYAMRFVGRWHADDTVAPVEFDTAVRGAFVRSRLDARVRAATASPPADETTDETTDADDISGTAVCRALGDSWLSGPPAGARAALTGSARWSSHELVVAAALAGAGTFPTIATEFMDGLPAQALDAAVDAAVGSLVARGLADRSDDGRAVVGEELRRILDVALAPGVVVWVERATEGPPQAWWLGVRRDAALLVTVLPDGGRETAWLDPELAVDHALTLISGSPGVTSVTVLSRTGDQVEGGTFAWETGEDGATALGDELDPADAETSTWRFAAAPIDTLRGHLLAQLPAD